MFAASHVGSIDKMQARDAPQAATSCMSITSSSMTKCSEAMACVSYRNILIGEGLTYIVALLCTKELIVTRDESDAIQADDRFV